MGRCIGRIASSASSPDIAPCTRHGTHVCSPSHTGRLPPATDLGLVGAISLRRICDRAKRVAEQTRLLDWFTIHRTVANPITVKSGVQSNCFAG